MLKIIQEKKNVVWNLFMRWKYWQKLANLAPQVHGQIFQLLCENYLKKICLKIIYVLKILAETGESCIMCVGFFLPIVKKIYNCRSSEYSFSILNISPWSKNWYLLESNPKDNTFVLFAWKLVFICDCSWCVSGRYPKMNIKTIL